jgi:hypothetical protein
MRESLAHQLEQLPQLDRKSLQDLWLELFGKPPHPKLRREVLVPILAYRMQEKALGGLKPSTLKKLHALAEDSGKKLSAKCGNRLRPGARIMREWQGQLHEVSVLAAGFDYRGQQYQSLSEIARQITGTRWSGPLFFGLKKRSAAGGAQ